MGLIVWPWVTWFGVDTSMHLYTYTYRINLLDKTRCSGYNYVVSLHQAGFRPCLLCYNTPIVWHTCTILTPDTHVDTHDKYLQVPPSSPLGLCVYNFLV
jgi:hypothetical protein